MEDKESILFDQFEKYIYTVIVVATLLFLKM